LSASPAGSRRYVLSDPVFSQTSLNMPVEIRAKRLNAFFMSSAKFTGVKKKTGGNVIQNPCGPTLPKIREGGTCFSLFP
jgi:hypothetical protein